jgi:hypothetical protein
MLKSPGGCGEDCGGGEGKEGIESVLRLESVPASVPASVLLSG